MLPDRCGFNRQAGQMSVTPASLGNPRAQAAGIVNANRMIPSALDAEIDPPCASTIDFAMAKPRPAPSPSFRREASTR